MTGLKKDFFSAVDGVKLFYRQIGPENGLKANLIMLHGANYNSLRYTPIGDSLRKAGICTYLPDFRGHGESGGKRGDTNYIGQLEDDLLQFVQYIQANNPDIPLIIGAHSSGSGVLLRYLEKKDHIKPDGYIIVSPFLISAKETQKDNRNQYKLSMTKILLTGIFKLLGISVFTHIRQIKFFIPEGAIKKENLVDCYSYNMSSSMDCVYYNRAFRLIDRPFLMLAGKNDERVYPERIESIFHWHVRNDIEKEFHYIENRNHMGIILNIADFAGTWILNLLEKKKNSEYAAGDNIDFFVKNHLELNNKLRLVTKEKKFSYFLFRISVLIIFLISAANIVNIYFGKNIGDFLKKLLMIVMNF